MTTQTPALSETAVETFRAGLRGTLLQPGDDGYAAACTLYNAMIDKHPALIARCSGVADVISAVRFAQTNNLPLAVKCGGHNVAGNALCDDGLVIDLSAMRGIRVDPVARTVRAQGGATWADLDRETQVFGLATTGGVISSTGIAGLTLGGGIGWLMRQYGLSCDNLLSVDMVTAGGSVLTASATDNPDLFWGVRGGGGNFGVVTSFEFQLHPVGQVLAGMLVYPFDHARAVLQCYRELFLMAPDELSMSAVLLTLPDGPPAVAIAGCYTGSLATAEQVVQPLRAVAPLLADELRPMSYCEAQTTLDAGFGPGLHNYWKSHFLTGLPDEAIDIILSHFARASSPLHAIGIARLGGAVGRVGREETAFPHRDAPFDTNIVGRWTDPAEAGEHIQWARTVWAALQPFSTGGIYVNYMSTGEEDQVRAAYGDATYDRLAVLKAKYDPTNLFRLNHNIQPERRTELAF
jgi:FAD/FMN-containing dehydrogenase